jgi:hypothetical protein
LVNWGGDKNRSSISCWWWWRSRSCLKNHRETVRI